MRGVTAAKFLFFLYPHILWILHIIIIQYIVDISYTYTNGKFIPSNKTNEQYFADASLNTPFSDRCAERQFFKF